MNTSEVNGFIMENPDKVRRVIEGTQTQHGGFTGGLGNGADPELVLAHYDKLAGLITKNGNKVKTGSFWDLKANAPRKEPEVVFEYRTEDGSVFEFIKDEPIQVQAEKAKKKKGKKK